MNLKKRREESEICLNLITIVSYLYLGSSEPPSRRAKMWKPLGSKIINSSSNLLISDLFIYLNLLTIIEKELKMHIYVMLSASRNFECCWKKWTFKRNQRKPHTITLHRVVNFVKSSRLYRARTCINDLIKHRYGFALPFAFQAEQNFRELLLQNHKFTFLQIAKQGLIQKLLILYLVRL